MGLFDRLRKLDRRVQGGIETAQGEVARGAAGVDWPRPSDPDGIDVLGDVEIAGRPYRQRSEGAEASGWEFRQHDVALLYDTWTETRNGTRITLVTWVEALHRPCRTEQERYFLADQYGFRFWRKDPADLSHLAHYLPLPYEHGRVPATGDPCLLVIVEPVVLRIRCGSMDTSGTYGTYGENATLLGTAIEVLARLDRDAVARWSAAIEPWADRFVDGPVGAVREALGAEAARIGDREDADRDLADRVVDAAERGASAAVLRTVLGGGASDLLRSGADRADHAAQARDAQLAGAAIPHLHVVARARAGTRRVVIDDAALTQAVAAATGLPARFEHDHLTEQAECRYVDLGTGAAAVVAFLPASAESAAVAEVHEAKRVGVWTIGTSADQAKRTTNVAVGRAGTHTIAVRLSGPTTPMTALKVAKAVAGLLGVPPR